MTHEPVVNRARRYRLTTSSDPGTRVIIISPGVVESELAESITDPHRLSSRPTAVIQSRGGRPDA